MALLPTEFSISVVSELPDPFLRMYLAGSTYIIERWDEPAYREIDPPKP